jgi:ribonuclease R
LPEAEIVFDEQGRMTGVKRSERNIAHRLIEEFMLAANEAVARRLMGKEYPFLHRVHETPSPKSIVEFEQIARSFGYSLGVEVAPQTFTRSRRRRDGTKQARETRAPRHIDVRSTDYQKLIAKLQGKPEERVLSYRMLRSFKQARYSEEPLGHFALATDEYCHFTSPIRRYPDLIVHRVLGALLDGRKPPLSEAELAQLGDHTSLTERRAAEAERALLDWKKAKFIEERLGDEFAGMVTNVNEYGMWVELEEMFIEGFVPVDSFEGERFHFRENQRALVGARSKTAYGLGKRVRVRVDRVSWDRMRPELTCLGEWKEEKS